MPGVFMSISREVQIIPPIYMSSNIFCKIIIMNRAINKPNAIH